MNRIVALIDFTGVAFVAVEHAMLIARENLCPVILLHVAEEAKKDQEPQLKEDIREYTMLLDKEGIPYSVQIRYGAFFEVISDCLRELRTELLVVGTHGIKGIKQNFLSSNILKLLRLIEVPSLIVQAHSQVPHEGYQRLLIPIAGPVDKALMINPVRHFSSIFHSGVYILGYYNPDNESQVKSCAGEISAGLSTDKIKPVVDLEQTSVYTSSYSKSIIQYADIEDIQVIALVIHEPEGTEFFDAFDKENILLNRLGKAVLCI